LSVIGIHHYASTMRTAVIRINVDPNGALGPGEIEQGMAKVLAGLGERGMSIVHADLAAQPAHRRELQFLAVGDDAAALQDSAAQLCRFAFDTAPANGTTTYLSRGTDEDALGVLAGFGLTGEMTRTMGEDGWDVVTVYLSKDDLRRVPESRIQTALEASLNCEVMIESA
jgi:hypothetical protein